jgi:hypothetical protein
MNVLDFLNVLLHKDFPEKLVILNDYYYTVAGLKQKNTKQILK